MDRPPSSGKGIIPLKTMVSDQWRRENPDAKLLDGALWLKGFYERSKDSDDLLEEDRHYLKELEMWHSLQNSCPATGVNPAGGENETNS